MFRTSLIAALLAVAGCDGGSSGKIDTDSDNNTSSNDQTLQSLDPAAATTAVIHNELQALELAIEDIRTVKKASLVRYFSIAHLADAGKGAEELHAIRLGVTRLINELSWQSKIIPLTAVDASGLLLRVPLDQYGWTAESWEKLAEKHPAANSAASRTLQSQTGTNKSLIRADWFVENAAKAPLYYELLSLPNTLAEFEGKLGINLLGNVASGNVIRAGFDNSSVSTNHRVIERHALESGYLWRSYEFGSKSGKKDIFQNPIGPEKAFQSGGSSGGSILGILGGGSSNRAFVDDGSEFLFTLPNGLLAFFIADGNGRRLNIVPNSNDKNIVVGAGCMRCHGSGPVDKPDMIVGRLSSSFPQDKVDIVKRLYVDPAAFTKQIESDQKVFRNVLKKLASP